MPTKDEINAGIRQRYLALFDNLTLLEGVTARSLAEKIGINFTIISSFRAGKRTPTYEHLLQLCDTYGYDLEIMIRGKKLGGKKPPVKSPAERIVRDEQSKERNK